MVGSDVLEPDDGPEFRPSTRHKRRPRDAAACRSAARSSAVIERDEPVSYVRYPAVSPDGSRIVFERALETGDIWTMTLPAR